MAAFTTRPVIIGTHGVIGRVPVGEGEDIASTSAEVSDHGECRVSKVALAPLRCWPGRRYVLEMHTRHEHTGS
jgi:hypothetical protein